MTVVYIDWLGNYIMKVIINVCLDIPIIQQLDIFRGSISRSSVIQNAIKEYIAQSDNNLTNPSIVNDASSINKER